MKNKILPIALFAGVLLLLSRKKNSEAAPADNRNSKVSPTDYVRMYFPLAQVTQDVYGVPALFTIAQAGLESGYGNSDIAKNSFNQFGIKADSTWKGASYKGFRKYNSIQESFDDHAKFLKNNSRYSPAFKTSNPEAFAKVVADAGYDAGPGYLNKVVTVMNLVKRATN